MELHKSGPSLGTISGCLKVRRSSVETITSVSTHDGNVQTLCVLVFGFYTPEHKPKALHEDVRQCHYSQSMGRKATTARMKPLLQKKQAKLQCANADLHFYLV